MTDKLRKYVLPNIPYVFIGWVFLKLGTAYRLAAGGDFAHKFIGLGQAVGAAFADFAPTGYLTRSGGFKEVYHGIEDIPAEHRIFAYPKLNIREQMAAYKEVIDRSSLEGERLHPRKEHDDR